MLAISSALLALLAVSASSAPIRREVPQEHSHEKIITSVRASLNINNPDLIKDPIFALLGDAAAAAGAGNIKDLSCLQQAVSDQAFTNAKEAGDVVGMSNALIFRALERNTGKVGLASALCSQTASNAEVQALTQHQDPASNNVAVTNKNITLELAKQIASIGGNPLDAIQSGTFAPGDLNDATGKGHTCDDANDTEGCIFSKNLLVPDASEDEINAVIAAIQKQTDITKADSNSQYDPHVDTEVATLVESASESNTWNSNSNSESIVFVQVSVLDASNHQISNTTTTVLVASGNGTPSALSPVISAADNNGTAVYQAKLTKDSP